MTLDKRKWRVGCTSCGTMTLYQVYRLLDPTGPNWKGNRETRGMYDNPLDAERLKDKLNEEEEWKIAVGIHDIVYLVKPSMNNEELKYSLRTVERNFPHRDVWLFGGCPDGIEPDFYVYVDQSRFGDRKWYRTTAMLERACREEGLSEWIWLFNDDFFIMTPPPSRIQPMYDCSMQDRIEQIESRYHGQSEYSLLLRQAKELLKKEGASTCNYATHTPLLINRKLALETIERFKPCPMFRCLYGNMWNIGGVNIPDVKVLDNDGIWSGMSWCTSTSDKAFAEGRIGRQIRRLFPDPSRWED